MRPSCWRLAVSLCFAVLFGCGSNKVSGGNDSFAESWHFDLSNSSLTLDAALTLSGNSVAGVAHFQSYTASSPCPSFFDDVPLSGTINEQGQVSLESSQVKGVVLSIVGQLTPDRASISTGIFRFTGGCEDGVMGSLSGQKVQLLSGVYTGTMQGSANTVSVSAQLTQAPQPDTHGLFAISGTVTLKNGCDQTYTLNGASVVGSVVHLYSSTSTGLEALTGVINPGAQQITLDDYLYSNYCIAGYRGIITRQGP